MNGIASSPMGIGSAWRFGLWSLATWSVLRLHDLPVAGEHSICGPWGCGPTIPALISVHGAWLLVAIPGSLLAGRRLRAKGWASTVGWACLGLGAAGLAAVIFGALMDRPGGRLPGARPYTVQRILFAVATAVDLPIVPASLAGVILLGFGRRRPGPAAGRGAMDEVAGACTDDACTSPAPASTARPVGRVRVGERLPALTVLVDKEEALAIPSGLAGRASILYFMRAANCSVCRKHVRGLVGMFDRQRLPEVEVVVVHPGGVETSRALADALSAPFTFASGRDSGAYDALGIPGRGFGAFRPCGTILLDGLGVVRHARLGYLPFGGFSESELVDAFRGVEGGPGRGALGD